MGEAHETLERPRRDLVRRAGEENFPVALRVLPRTLREDLMAIYGYARFVDDVGDELVGDRRRTLDEVEAGLRRLLAAPSATPQVGTPRALVDAARLLRRHGLDPAPLFDLITANRIDQDQREWETFDDLLDYCRYSATPVGRLVLGVLGVDDPRLVERSDAVCSALQVLEHLQDVGEDLGRGRIYLPKEDRRRFGVTPGDLAARSAGAALRRLVAFEVGRSRRLLAAGSQLVAELRGAGRLAVAGFVAGGIATADAIAAADYDVLETRCRPRAATTVRHLLRLQLAGRLARGCAPTSEWGWT